MLIQGNVLVYIVFFIAIIFCCYFITKVIRDLNTNSHTTRTVETELYDKEQVPVAVFQVTETKDPKDPLDTTPEVEQKGE